MNEYIYPQVLRAVFCFYALLSSNFPAHVLCISMRLKNVLILQLDANWVDCGHILPYGWHVSINMYIKAVCQFSMMLNTHSQEVDFSRRGRGCHIKLTSTHLSLVYQTVSFSTTCTCQLCRWVVFSMRYTDKSFSVWGNN